MASARQIRHLVAYNEWADRKILAAIAPLSASELDAPREAYVGSIAKNLRHTVAAQLRWLARFKGEPLPPMDQPEGLWPDVYAVAHQALARYLTPLSDADFDRRVKFTLASGASNEQPLGQLVIHLVNHGTAHRAETGLLLERLGHSPGDLDYLLFIRDHPAPA
jgi:uncharacterized damage-inducible protein DinB